MRNLFMMHGNALIDCALCFANTIKNSIAQVESSRKYLMFVEHLCSTDNSLADTLKTKITSMMFDGLHRMKIHIIGMTNILAKLQS